MQTVITGPCLLTWNNTTFYSKGNVVVNFQRNTRTVSTAQHGPVGNRHVSSVITVTFEPSGLQAEGLAVLAWMQGRAVGQSLVPGGTGNEKALVVTPIMNSGGASKIWTFHRAGPTQLQNIRVGSGQEQWGQITFSVLESEVTAGSFYSPGNYSAPTLNFDPGNVVTLPCRLRYCADQGTPASGDLLMDSINGWTIGVNLSAITHQRETCGIADITLQSLAFNLTGQAANIYDYTGALMAESAWPDVMEFETLRPGQVPVARSVALRAIHADEATPNLVDTGTDLFSLNKAEMTRASLAWGSGADSNRTLDVEFISRPSFSSGVLSNRLAYYS